MSAIKQFIAQEIIDSSGYPTLKGQLILDNNLSVELEVPSTINYENSSELKSLRDQEDRYLGYGMQKAVEIINKGISEKLKGVSVFQQKEIDIWLNKADPSEKKEKLGASTLMLVSYLCALAGAKLKNQPLYLYLNQIYNNYYEKIKITTMPTPIITLINGGKYSNNMLDFKEFYLLFSSKVDFSKSIEISVETYHRLKETLTYRKVSTSMAEQGGFSPNLSSNLDAFDLMLETFIKGNLKLGLDVFTGIDAGADDYYTGSGYKFTSEPQEKTPSDYYKFLNQLIKDYHLLYLEDAFSKQDLKNKSKFYEEINNFGYIAQDYFDNYGLKSIENEIKQRVFNTLVLKITRYPTLTDVFSIVDLCKKNNITYVISQEVSETNQTFSADLAVGLQAEFVKFGAPVKGERVVKYNRLLEISKELEKNNI
ncbi:MAG: enolase [Patescibacteria group bacterium]|nr:MAG: enolase [Patescibacteria group bacterium]